MLEPISSASSSPSPQANEPASGETVTRPEPGLARGKWEAPPWAFWAALAVVLIATALYLLRRMGMLALKTKGPKA